MPFPPRPEVQAPSICGLSAASFLPPPSAFPLPTHPRCINIYTPGLAGIFLQLLPWSLGELVLSLNSCSRSGCLWSDKGRPWFGGLQSPWGRGCSWREKLSFKEVTGLWQRSILSPPPAAYVATLQELSDPCSGWGGGPCFSKEQLQDQVCSLRAELLEGWRIIPKQTGWC